MRNRSHQDGMMSLQEFGLYYADCAKDDKPLPIIEKIETGVEVSGWFPSDDGFRNAWFWFDCGSVDTEIPEENYDEIKIWSQTKIVFTPVTENYRRFVEGNDKWGWPTLYWG